MPSFHIYYLMWNHTVVVEKEVLLYVSIYGSQTIILAIVDLDDYNNASESLGNFGLGVN